MLKSTLRHLICPQCGPKLSQELKITECQESAGDEITFGTLQCSHCKTLFPILAGVAIVLVDVESYLLEHVKGISQHVPVEKIPKPYRADFRQALEEIQPEHIEEDLESERVNSLYFINHYLDLKSEFWRSSSPLIDDVIRKNWEKNPFYEIQKILESSRDLSVVEIGCGPGGLLNRIHSNTKFFLGIDSSFASIALARHLQLRAGFSGKIRIPQDLLDGPVSKEIAITPRGKLDGSADFIVSDLLDLAVKRNSWDLSVALNVIDMLDDPRSLPELQKSLSKNAVQSCPYIWHQNAAKKIRKSLPKSIPSSAEAVKKLYTDMGFRVEKEISDVPWLFFKHLRQLEIYSVHLMKFY